MHDWYRAERRTGDRWAVIAPGVGPVYLGVDDGWRTTEDHARELVDAWNAALRPTDAVCPYCQGVNTRTRWDDTDRWTWVVCLDCGAHTH